MNELNKLNFFNLILFVCLFFKEAISNERKFVSLNGSNFELSSNGNLTSAPADGSCGSQLNVFELNRDLIEEAKHDVETDLNKLKLLQTKINEIGELVNNNNNNNTNANSGSGFYLTNRTTSNKNLLSGELESNGKTTTDVLDIEPLALSAAHSLNAGLDNSTLNISSTTNINTTTNNNNNKLDYYNLLENNLKDLINKIDIKKRLISELETNTKGVEQMRIHYEEKMSILHDRIKQIEDERDRIILNMSMYSIRFSISRRYLINY